MARTELRVRKWQDTAFDGLPIGTVLIWRGEWDRSPADVAGRERDAMPALYWPGGQRAPATGASDWEDIATGEYPEAWQEGG
jgi:hypothetical protein